MEPTPDSVEPAPKPRRVIPPERLAMAEKLYLEGAAAHRIRAALCEEFSVSPKTARRYLARVLEKFAKVPAPTVEAVRARSEAMLLHAYSVAEGKVGATGMPTPDTATMATCAVRLAELNGAMAPKKVDLTSKGQPIQMFFPVEREP